jgi:C4-dicarboxylate-specific signal transduction histidine kinase
MSSTTEYSHPTFDLVDGQRVVLDAPPVIELDLDRLNPHLARVGIPVLEVDPDGTVFLDSAGTLRYRRVPQARQWGSMARQVEIWERIEEET